MADKLKRQYSVLLIFFIILGFISGLYLVYQRHNVEHVQNRIENIVEYDAIIRASSYEKSTLEESLNELRKAGVTAMAIYDRTLEKARDAGEIRVLHGADTHYLQFYGEGAKAGATYVLPVPGKEGYFKEIWEDLNHRLGNTKVVLKNTTTGPALELMQPYTSLMDMKLSISRLQAEEVNRLGFNVIVRPSNFKGVTKEDIDYVFHRIDGIHNLNGIVFVGKEVLGYPDYIDETLVQMNVLHLPVVGIEAVNQLQYDTQAGFDKMAIANGYSVGRLYTITKEEMKKLSPEEVSQWFYISDIERNIRFNLYPIYEEGKDNQTALGTSLLYMNSVKEKLQERGFEFGRASVYPKYKPNVIPLMVVMIGAIALFTFVLNLFIAMPKNKQYLIFASLSFASIILYAVTNGTVISQIWALSSAILAPTGAIILLMDCWAIRTEGEKKAVSNISAMLQAVIYTVTAALIASIGASYIAALLGNTRFFMEFALFRGVKLTFVLPILLVVIAYFQHFPLWKNKKVESIAESKAFIKDFFMADVKVYTLFILGALVAVLYVFVGRSGHTAGVPVPNFELQLRRFLENTLYARPREKEFLIGHPALMIAAFATLKRWPMVLHFFFTVGGVIGVGSMVETFCHLRTPVMMSIMRGIDGLGLGILFGILGIIVVRFLMYVTEWYQKQEVGNE